MNLNRSKLRLEQLERRENPAAVNVGFGTTVNDPVLFFNVAGYTLSQNNAGFATTSSAFGFNDAGMTAAQAVTTANGGTVNATLSDAFDGALSWGLANFDGSVTQPVNNGPLTYVDADGIVDVTGPQINANTWGAGAIVTGSPNDKSFAGDTFNGLSLRQQNAVFNVNGEPVIRSLFYVQNTTAGTISRKLGVYSNLGSDNSTKIYASSNGDTAFQAGVDTYVGSFEDYTGNLSTDVRLMTQLQGGFGRIKQGLDATSFYQNGANNTRFVFDTTLAAGETKAFLIFTSLHASKAAGVASTANFNSLSALRSSGLLAGLDDSTLTLIQNWDLDGLPSAGGEAISTLEGQLARIKTFDAAGNPVGDFSPFEGYFGGVNVARADFDGDGVVDIAAGIATGGSHVKVFSGVDGALLASFFTFEGFNGGVSIGTGDVNGDGTPDLIVGTATCGSHVKVFNLVDQTEIASFVAFDGFTGGVTVAGGDVNADGYSDIVVGQASGGSHVKVFSGVNFGELYSFFAFDSGYISGINVAGGDVNGDGFADIIVGSSVGATNVKSFSGTNGSEQTSFFAYEGSLGGVSVAVVDADGDGTGEIGTGSRIGSHVKAFNLLGLTEVDSFFAFGEDYTGGIDIG